MSFSAVISHGDLGLVHHTQRQLNSCLTQPASSHTQRYCQISAATSILCAQLVSYSQNNFHKLNTIVRYLPQLVLQLVTILTYSLLLSDIRRSYILCAQLVSHSQNYFHILKTLLSDTTQHLFHTRTTSIACSKLVTIFTYTTLLSDTHFICI